ncbi:MAG: FKBP-type peptidyl-prolyl cis-trans isomerase [bacterium]
MYSIKIDFILFLNIIMKKKTLILIVALVVILAAAVALLYNKGMFASKHYYGKSVSVNYVGRFTDGRVFDTSIEEVAKKNARYNPQRGYAPLTFIVGSGDVVSGFENAIEGMAIGETKTVTLAPKDAYGEYDSGKIVWIPKTPFTQAKIEPKVNQSFSFSGKTFTIE